MNITWLGRYGARGKRHARLVGRAISLPIVAGSARRRKIFPGIPSAPGPRKHMIHGQSVPATAILTPESIPPENVFPGDHDPLVRNVHVGPQTHNAWAGKLDRRRTKIAIRDRLHQLGFLQKNQHDGALDAACGQCAVVVVQHEYVAFHGVTASLHQYVSIRNDLAQPIENKQAMHARRAYQRYRRMKQIGARAVRPLDFGKRLQTIVPQVFQAKRGVHGVEHGHRDPDRDEPFGRNRIRHGRVYPNLPHIYGRRPPIVLVFG